MIAQTAKPTIAEYVDVLLDRIADVSLDLQESAVGYRLRNNDRQADRLDLLAERLMDLTIIEALTWIKEHKGYLASVILPL